MKEIKNIESILNIFDCEYEVIDNSNNVILKSLLFDNIRNSSIKIDNTYKMENKYYEYYQKNVDIEDNKYTINMYKDITKYQLDIMKLKEDVLTKLPNRCAIETFINSYGNNDSITVICDLDNFKNINDTYGHDQGDIVLREFGHILKSLLSQNVFVGRYGGEEFVIFFKGTNIRYVKEQLSNVRKLIVNNNYLTNDKYQIQMSAGISIVNNNKILRDGIKEADMALYYVKNNGKNADAIYDDKTNNCYIIE